MVNTDISALVDMDLLGLLEIRVQRVILPIIKSSCLVISAGIIYDNENSTLILI